MKNIIIRYAFVLISAAVLCSCADLKRNNPTDPKGTNYIGIHYTGAIGSFSDITDLAAYDGKLYASDSGSKKVYCFRTDGQQEWMTQDGTFILPTGVSVSGTRMAVADSGANKIMMFDLTDFSYFENNSIGYAPGKVRTDGTKVVVSDPAGKRIWVYDMLLGSGVSFGSDGTADGQFREITDIKINGSNIVVADNVLKRITVFNGTYIFVNTFEMSDELKGFEIKDGTIYLPTSSGIKEYSYASGAFIKKWADYGEGNGRLVAPAWIAMTGSGIYTDNKTEIKEFIP